VFSVSDKSISWVDYGIELGHQLVQIQPVPVGHLLHRIEQCLATDAFARSDGPTP
jgi:hypothetical protein